LKGRRLGREGEGWKPRKAIVYVREFRKSEKQNRQHQKKNYLKKKGEYERGET